MSSFIAKDQAIFDSLLYDPFNLWFMVYYLFFWLSAPYLETENCMQSSRDGSHTDLRSTSVAIKLHLFQ